MSIGTKLFIAVGFSIPIASLIPVIAQLMHINDFSLSVGDILLSHLSPFLTPVVVASIALVKKHVGIINGLIGTLILVVALAMLVVLYYFTFIDPGYIGIALELYAYFNIPVFFVSLIVLFNTLLKRTS